MSVCDVNACGVEASERAAFDIRMSTSLYLHANVIMGASSVCDDSRDPWTRKSSWTWHRLEAGQELRLGEH